MCRMDFLDLLSFFSTFILISNGDKCSNVNSPITTYVSNDATTDMVSRHSDLFSNSEYCGMINKQRIRREIRELSSNEWNSIVDAMWIMKDTSQIDGELLYGDDFRNYDELVCKHMMAYYDSRGDQGHFGAHFIIWHRLYVLEFERSLLSIDKRIESMPYWNVLIDNDDTYNSEIFSDDYFGSYQPYLYNDDNSSIVKNGKFSYWPIGTLSDISNTNSNNQLYCQNLTNPFGQLRSRINVQSSEYTVRHGNYICDLQFGLMNQDQWPLCLFNTSDITEWQNCQDPQIHGSVHWSVGGTTDMYDGQPSSINDADNIDGIINADWISNLGFRSFPSNWCANWAISGFRINSLVFPASHPDANCWNCLTSNECIIGVNTSYECQCTVIDSNDELYPNGNHTCTYRNLTINLLPEQFSPNWGDFLDTGTSPNDPIFMFHHANLDRFFSHWLLETYDLKDDYWDYPTNETIGYGGNLNDIISDNYPFYNVLENNCNNDIGEGPYSAKDVLDSIFTKSAFTYDTLIDAIYREIDSSSSDYSDSSRSSRSSSSSSD